MVEDDGPASVIPGGKGVWEESEDIREKRKQAALRRKAIRAARRAAQGDE